jgi:hypothetical protein
MIGATRQIEITIRTINQPALLSKLIAITVSCGAEVLAANSYWDGGSTVVKLVTEDARRTVGALQAAGFNCRSNPVVLVETPDKPGLPEFLSGKLASAGINVLYTYSFRSDRELNYVVFRTTDDNRAIYILEVEALIHGLVAAKNWKKPGAKDVGEPDVIQHAA